MSRTYRIFRLYRFTGVTGKPQLLWDTRGQSSETAWGTKVDLLLWVLQSGHRSPKCGMPDRTWDGSCRIDGLELADH